MTFYKQLIHTTIFVIFLAGIVSCGTGNEETTFSDGDSVEGTKAPSFEYGIETDSFSVIQGVIKKNEFLSDILLRYNVPYGLIHKISEKSKDVYDVRRLGRGKNYTLLCAKDSLSTARYFIYQANEIDYVIYYFQGDSVDIKLGAKPITLVEQLKEGIIKSSLYNTLIDSNQNVLLAFEMADIFAWTIDFYRLQPGDKYTILYTEMQVENKCIGIKRVNAVVFNHEGKDFRAYYYKQDSTGADYFDEEAQSLRKAFLKSPLKYSRLSSGFTQRRFHPVQKRWKAHLGTDYAAPSGTPIMSTGDGVITEASHKAFNGNYVKIRHNSVYNTQYLHMSRIAKGIKPGVYVKQGDVIGYVGSTGLATGPHVCYRFWKNGSQVNHLHEEFPPSEPIQEKNMADFKEYLIKVDSSLQNNLSP